MAPEGLKWPQICWYRYWIGNTDIVSRGVGSNGTPSQCNLPTSRSGLRAARAAAAAAAAPAVRRGAMRLQLPSGTDRDATLGWRYGRAPKR